MAVKQSCACQQLEEKRVKGGGVGGWGGGGGEDITNVMRQD